HKARETTLAACRKTIQACAASIRAVHREQFDSAEELSAQAAAHLAEALKAVEEHKDIRYAGFVHHASKEYAEARMTRACVRGVLERTRGDLTTSLLQTRLLEGIEGRSTGSRAAESG